MNVVGIIICSCILWCFSVIPFASCARSRPILHFLCIKWMSTACKCITLIIANQWSVNISKSTDVKQIQLEIRTQIIIVWYNCAHCCLKQNEYNGYTMTCNSVREAWITVNCCLLLHMSDLTVVEGRCREATAVPMSAFKRLNYRNRLRKSLVTHWQAHRRTRKKRTKGSKMTTYELLALSQQSCHAYGDTKIQPRGEFWFVESLILPRDRIEESPQILTIRWNF